MSAITQRPTTGSVLLSAVDWKEYKRFLRMFAERPGIRLTYDRGELEIMAPSFEHEDYCDFLGRLVLVLTEELRMPIRHGGSVTLRRRKWKRGLESDRCYWIKHEAQMRGVKNLDLRIHPPPDLAIEVDVTRSSLNRMAIYAKLRVPEVWRLDNSVLTFSVLQPDGNYALATHSLGFPQVTPNDLMRFLAMCATAEQNAIVAQFRQWIRQLPPVSP
jgi:Uma2 family endonuclease